MYKRIKFKKKGPLFVNNVFFEFESLDGKLKEGQVGYGCVKYPEGSIYRGSLIYVGDDKLEKYGYGEQDFTNSIIRTLSVGGIEGDTLYKYIGFYDYRKTGWICGNGILYFTKDGKPSHYAKGYFETVKCVRDWEGEFTTDLLLPGYTEDMEIKLKPCLHEKRLEVVEKIVLDAQGKDFDSVLLGDSWMEFFDYNRTQDKYGPFRELNKDSKSIAIGIGGSTYHDWLEYSKEYLKGYTFKRVVVSLGGNDLHHGASVEQTIKDFLEFVKIVKSFQKDAKIYIFSVFPTPCYSTNEKEKEYDSKIIEIINTLENVYYIDDRAPFVNDDYTIKKKSYKYYDKDGLHLSTEGNNVWSKYFKDLI